MKINEPTIDWLIDELAPNKGKSPLIDFNKKRLKEAIYKAGLEAIGEDEGYNRYPTSLRHAKPGRQLKQKNRDELRAEQRQAWAQLCGIEGESE